MTPPSPRIHWQNPAYLLRGSERQRAAHRALEALGIFRVLASFRPVLAGTVPLGIDLPESDLDVVCEAHDLAGFEETVRETYGGRAGFVLNHRRYQELPAVVCNFFAEGYWIELFGQPLTALRGRACRHLVVEARLLALGGEPLRAAIRGRRAAGQKTEPAFAKYLGLPGDPYEALLELEGLPDAALRRLIEAVGKTRQ
jgi:hypothetical protein